MVRRVSGGDGGARHHCIVQVKLTNSDASHRRVGIRACNKEPPGRRTCSLGGACCRAGRPLLRRLRGSSHLRLLLAWADTSLSSFARSLSLTHSLTLSSYPGKETGARRSKKQLEAAAEAEPAATTCGAKGGRKGEKFRAIKAREAAAQAAAQAKPPAAEQGETPKSE